MTTEELRCAFLSVSLAIRDKIQYPKSKISLRNLAYSYGKKVSKPRHIDKVFECIDLQKMESLVHDSFESGVLKKGKL